MLTFREDWETLKFYHNPDYFTEGEAEACIGVKAHPRLPAPPWQIQVQGQVADSRYNDCALQSVALAQGIRRLRLGVWTPCWPVGEESTAPVITPLLMPCVMPAVESASHLKQEMSRPVRIVTAAPCPLSVDLLPVLRVRRANYSL